ncbi:hypothetical protein BC938DRAFT_476179 [Jimgerdemannia flammicorona]|uniref:MalT-like TPR region domain-containing protein n=1 Tax=Jimgerdemannia flammicorona TaxID=994334 RepID=A0A433PJM9_9FUNG|nr:hypothetical protein BC938DRAFT_476179 [Jimgerdemannia flammicorona]
MCRQLRCIFHQQILARHNESRQRRTDNTKQKEVEENAYDKAEPLYERTLAIREGVGIRAPIHGRISGTFGWGLLQTGKYDKVEPLYGRALATRQKMLGSENIFNALSLLHLAELYYSQGKYDKVEALYKRALAIFGIRAPRHGIISE